MFTETKSKYTLTTTPPGPGKCIGCGKQDDTHTEFVDLTNSLDYYGAILLCRPCAYEIATALLELVPNDAVAEAIEYKAMTDAFIANQTEKMKSLERVVAAYLIGLDLGDRDSSSPSDKGEERPVENSPEPVDEVGGKKQGLFR